MFLEPVIAKIQLQSQPGLGKLRPQFPWVHETMSTTQDVKPRLCQAVASVRCQVCDVFFARHLWVQALPVRSNHAFTRSTASHS